MESTRFAAGRYKRLSDLSEQVVIGASRRGQLAREGYAGHGVFTAALLRVLKGQPEDAADRALRVTALRTHLDTEVRRITRGTGGDQQRVAGFLVSADFPVALR